MPLQNSDLMAEHKKDDQSTMCKKGDFKNQLNEAAQGGQP
jgi:hypothetical protein